MPYAIIADEIEHALRRLMRASSVEKTQEKIVDGALGAGAYDRMKELAKEEAKTVVRRLREEHWLIKKEEPPADEKQEGGNG